jgi:hypothetical protein
MINKTVCVFLFFLPEIKNTFTHNTSFMDSAKFFVVVGVLTIILAGIFFFLIYLERKISKLEQQSTKK